MTLVSAQRLVRSSGAKPQAARFHVTIIHPCVGRREGNRSYLHTWKMESLPAALLSALLPPDVERAFWDDRLEPIPYDAPTDLVAISVETYTAKRSYQIASEYRARGVPVVMGGYHATLATEETLRFAESVVVGEAETTFPELIDDYRHGRPQKLYRASGRADPSTVTPDRRIFRQKSYLPIRLIEFARGCKYRCDFCAVQSFHAATQTQRRVDHVVAELARIRRPGQLVFFIDDNITSDLEASKELMRAIAPMGLRWVGQSSINVAFDDEAMSLMKRSGCQGLLVGFESLDPSTLRAMKKGFNTLHGGAPAALAQFRRHGIRVYGTFIFGYDHDTDATFDETVAFAESEGLFIAAFNSITPFPGTPLYARLAEEGRLRMEPWWLHPDYRYGMVPFEPRSMDPHRLAIRSHEARRRFYGWRSIARRLTHRTNYADPVMAAYFVAINALHRFEGQRYGLPLGDAGQARPLLEAV